ncbi:hypothetical protein E3P77_02366 [Wallemia ichthyophaga]|uniref:Myb-like domain-containing protein n=2 Tax=Wallemia ichthyophaga TaxID=245174 RepID=A0A4T0HCY0_WALIC|nr:hypothetical protein E3P90_02854 [Wallemia ichthyophaga]TIB12242.1 hypothetical protein E3P93_02333 [Wallemia ichthyophaga]TIB66229.1 hypothetical protein E3P77_02366 [Wallemia ichthyophaga]
MASDIEFDVESLKTSQIPTNLLAMMAENAPSVVAARNPNVYAGKGKQARKWKWESFTNPARSDGLQLRHWKRLDEFDEPYPYARFNTTSEPYSYSEDEYDRMLQDVTWSRDETDYLVKLIHEFDVRWPVIWDRYEWRSGRTLEDLKARYFDICRKLIQSRISSDESSTNQLLQAYQFDKEREMMRKQYVNSLFARTPQQITEEEELYIEAKRIEQDERKWRCERDELVRTVSMSRNEKRKASGGADIATSTLAPMSTSNEEQPHKRTAKSAAYDAQHYITRPSSHLPLKSSSNIPPFSRATKLAQKITPQRIRECLQSMGLSDKLQYPTAANVAKYEGVKEATAQLQEIRRAHERVANELRLAKGISVSADERAAASTPVARAASEHPTPTSTPKPTTPAPENSMGLSTDSSDPNESNDLNKRRKLQSWGIFGSVWPIINRVVIAILWFAVQTYIGGNCIRVMLRCWDPNWTTSAGLQKQLDTNLKGFDMVCFIIFWSLMLIPTYFPIQKIKHFFTFKAIVAPLGLIIFFGWSLGRATATPSQEATLKSVLTSPSTLTSSEQGWEMVKAIVRAISNAVTLILNISDLASRAHDKKNVVFPQLLTVPLGFFITSFFGVIIASCYQAETGIKEWDPMVILDNFINPDSAAVRFAVWFIAFCLCVAQMGTNQAANVIACGCDLTACLPSYINNRRGGYICVFLGLCLVPWRLTDGATSFTNYLSGYCVFLSAIAGTMLSDYFVVRRGRANVADLYRAEGWYSYTYGVNLRAVAAYLCGVSINLPGFIASTPGNEEIVGRSATRIYNLSFFTGFLVSSVIYIAISYIFPPTGAVPFNAPFEEIDFSGYTHDTDSIYDLEVNGLGGMADGGIAITTTKTDSSSIRSTRSTRSIEKA